MEKKSKDKTVFVIKTNMHQRRKSMNHSPNNFPRDLSIDFFIYHWLVIKLNGAWFKFGDIRSNIIATRNLITKAKRAWKKLTRLNHFKNCSHNMYILKNHALKNKISRKSSCILSYSYNITLKLKYYYFIQ